MQCNILTRITVLLFKGTPTCDRNSPKWKKIPSADTDYGDLTKSQFPDSLYRKLSEYNTEFGQQNFLDSLRDGDKTLSADTERIRKDIVKNIDYMKRLKELRQSKFLTADEKRAYLKMLKILHNQEGDPDFIEVFDATDKKYKPALVVVPTKDKYNPFEYYDKDLTQIDGDVVDIPERGYKYNYDFAKAVGQYEEPRQMRDFLELAYKINGYERNSFGEQLINDMYDTIMRHKNGGWVGMSHREKTNIKNWLKEIELFKESLPITKTEYQELLRFERHMVQHEGLLTPPQRARYEELRRKPPMVTKAEGNKGGFAIHHAMDSSHPSYHIQEAARHFFLKHGFEYGTNGLFKRFPKKVSVKCVFMFIRVI